MKKSILFVFAALFAASTMAQTSDSGLRVWENNVVTYQAPVDNIDSITFVSKSEIGETLIGDLITGITPIIEDEVQVGYTMSFLHHDPINIYHGPKGDKGDKGEKGDSMLQSITQDEDSVYFTLANGSVISLQKTPNKPKDFEQMVIDNLVNSLDIDKPFINILLGETEQITATTAPFSNSQVNWTSSNPSVATVDNGLITTHDYGYTLITAQSANRIKTCDVYVVDDLSKYAISVSASKKVYFSHGNLQYKSATEQWRLAYQQYDCIGSKQNSAGWSDYFYGGITANTNFSEISITNASTDYDTYRLLSKDEWNYIAKRSGKSVFGNIEGYNGLILLPDYWICPDGITYTTGNVGGYSINSFSYEEWSLMEQNGAVFIRACGELDKNTVSMLDNCGLYFSSDYVNNSSSPYSYVLKFWNGSYSNGDGTATEPNYWNNYGNSIRLVQDVK